MRLYSLLDDLFFFSPDPHCSEFCSPVSKWKQTGHIPKFSPVFLLLVLLFRYSVTDMRKLKIFTIKIVDKASLKVNFYLRKDGILKAI